MNKKMKTKRPTLEAPVAFDKHVRDRQVLLTIFTKNELLDLQAAVRIMVEGVGGARWKKLLRKLEV